MTTECMDVTRKEKHRPASTAATPAPRPALQRPARAARLPACRASRSLLELRSCWHAMFFNVVVNLLGGEPLEGVILAGATCRCLAKLLDLLQQQRRKQAVRQRQRGCW